MPVPFGRRAAALLAALALALQLALPAVAFAAFAGHGTRVPVCTPAGIVWMDLGTQFSVPGADTDRTAVHCPLCFAQGAPALPPPPVIPTPAWPLVSAPLPSAADVAAPAAQPWVLHPGRAPPVSA